MSSRLLPLPTIGELLKLYNVRALKKLSQNFLLNLRLTDKLVRQAGKLNGVEVCEIGPGPGGITRSILKQNPKRFIVIEKDSRFKPILENLAECSYCKLDIIFNDIMGYDMSSLFDPDLKKTWEDEPPSIHLIGNLPFSISTPLIVQWMKDIYLRRSAWSYGRVQMTLTFQEEVAQRIVAPEGDNQRCRMSVVCQNYCEVHHKFTINGTAFIPKPDVNVGVVHFKPLVKPVIPYDFQMIQKVLRVVFNCKKKYSFTTAMNLFPKEMCKDLTAEMYERAELSPQLRAFQFSLEDWKRLCSAYKHICDRNPKLYNYDYRGSRETREEDWKKSPGGDFDEDVEAENSNDKEPVTTLHSFSKLV